MFGAANNPPTREKLPNKEKVIGIQFDYFAMRIVSLLIGALMFMTGVLQAAPGDLDASFGTNGVVSTEVVSGADEVITAMAVQSDGKIVVSGYTLNTSTNVRRYALVRYNSNGSLDAGFGTNGATVVSLSSISIDESRDIVIQPDGKILVLGESWHAASNSSSQDVVLLRFNSDGTPDLTFDSNGSVITDIYMAIAGGITGSVDNPTRIALQPDGKILVAALSRVSKEDIVVLRYNSDGSLDTTFSSDGIFTYNLNPAVSIADYSRAIAVQPDGKIVVAGEWWLPSGPNNKNPFVLRLDSTGVLDSSFGANGVAESLDIKIGDDVKDLLIQPDGKIIVAGFARDEVGGVNGADFLLIRYNADGTLDTSFSADGVVVTDANASSRDQGYSVVLQADGKILLGGLSVANDMLLRYNTDGTLDNTFSGDGMATSGSLRWSFATVIQPDGKILNAANNSSNRFALARYEGDDLDIQPDAFNFTDETGVNSNELVTSNLITVAGLAAGVSVPVTVTGGEYALNGATTYTATLSYVQNGDQINVRHTSAVAGGTASTVLTIGGQHAPDNISLVLGDTVVDTFTSTSSTSTTTTTTSGGSDSDGSGGGGGSISGFILLLTSLLLVIRRKLN